MLILLVFFDLFFLSDDNKMPQKPYFLELTDYQKQYKKENPEKEYQAIRKVSRQMQENFARAKTLASDRYQSQVTEQEGGEPDGRVPQRDKFRKM